MDKKDGGPAFPVSSYVNAMGQTFDSSVQGMTLRDYFAAKAMQGCIAGLATKSDDLSYEGCASLAYQMADAMLKERERD
jgi:hypothetical protein